MIAMGTAPRRGFVVPQEEIGGVVQRPAENRGFGIVVRDNPRPVSTGFA